MLEQVLLASGALIIGLIIFAYASVIAKQPKKIKTKKEKVYNKPAERLASKIDDDLDDDQNNDPTWSFLSSNIFHDDSHSMDYMYENNQSQSYDN